MKALSQFSVYLLLVLLVVVMAMMVQSSELFGVTNADPDLPPKDNDGLLYYIHKDTFTDVQLALKSCAADGGKLVEIGTWSEFHFIENYLKSIRDQDNLIVVYIAGNYKADVNTWFFPTSGQPVPVPYYQPAWHLEYFNLEWNLNCLALKYGPWRNLYYMDAASCTAEGSIPDRFMCEKVYASYYGPNPTQLPNADPNIPAIEFRSKIYYYYKLGKPLTNVEINRHYCRLDGGMMVQIDDEYEMVVVQKYISSTLGYGDLKVFIGGLRDKTTNYKWVLPSNNKPLHYVQWGTNEPVGKTPTTHLNCLILDGEKDLDMASFPCLFSYDTIINYRVLCEIPKSSLGKNDDYVPYYITEML